jgi:hypothetical protein
LSPAQVQQILIAAALVGLVASAFVQARAQGQRRHAELMKKKLAHGQKILEGIALENFETIGKNARDLKSLSEDSEWNVFPDMDYVRYSTEFRTICDDLSSRAKDRNLDGATLCYMQLTMNCVNCHKFVRVRKK